MSAALDRLGPSEAQSRALYDQPYLAENWKSRAHRNDRRRPPAGIDALVRWYQAECEAVNIAQLHKGEVWADHGLSATGGSALGTRAFTDAFRKLTELAYEQPKGGFPGPHAKDHDGEFLWPMLSALASMRKPRRHQHDLLMALAAFGFDWRSLAGRSFYRRQRLDSGDVRRYIVLIMPEDILRVVLEDALRELWRVTGEREGSSIRRE